MGNKEPGSSKKDNKNKLNWNSPQGGYASRPPVGLFNLREGADGMTEHVEGEGDVRFYRSQMYDFAEPPKEPDWKRFFIWVCMAMVSLAFWVFVASFIASKVFAYEVPNNIWQGLIAEDVGGGYRGMYAVACVVRNRQAVGLNHGLCAMKRKDLDTFCKKQGKKYEVMAKEIVRKVFVENSPDVTNGATHYEAVERYGVPYWAKSMRIVARIGEHTYYREIRRKS